MWKMLHEQNAIEATAITIRFAEPLSSMTTKKALRELESVAFKQGFSERAPMQGFQFHITPQNADVTQGVQGMAFQHISVDRDINGIVGPQLFRQFVFQSNQLIMQINKYRGWEKEWPATLQMLSPVLDLALGVVPVSGVRLEYLNRFIFDGAPGEASAKNVLKPSNLLAEHIFSSPTFWHSHTGFFDEVSEESRRLVQVNADMQSLNPPHPFAGNKTLALMLAVERQFEAAGLEIDPTNFSDILTGFFTSLHDGIHNLFKSMIDSNFASENRLPR